MGSSNADTDVSCNPSARWGTPILTLSAYLRFWSFACFGVTLWLIFFQKEVGSDVLSWHAHPQADTPLLPPQRKEALSEDETSITSVYKSIWKVSQLKSSYPSPTHPLINARTLTQPGLPYYRRPILPAPPSRLQDRLCGPRLRDGA